MRTDVGDQGPVPASPDHPLDNPVWSALTGRQAVFAEGGDLALRYPAAIAPFAAMGSATDAAYTALERLVPRDTQVALVRPEPLGSSSGLLVVGARPIHQMIVADGRFGAEGAADLTDLGASDVEDMLRLTGLTNPGPFAPRTHELGHYLGIRADGMLVAMAGERMRLDGHIEISAVCVHPDFRGRGHAQRLISTLAGEAIRSGSIPFLHVFADNASAIATYLRLGFLIRRTIYLTRLRNSG